MNTTLFRLRTALLVVVALAAVMPPSQAQQAATPGMPVAAGPLPAGSGPQDAEPQDSKTQDIKTQGDPAATAAALSPAASPANVELGAGAPGAAAVKSTRTGLDEMSPVSMFLKADIVVKAVMIALALASVATWTTLIAKSLEFSMLRRKLGGALRKISTARSLAEAQLALGPAKSILSSLLHAVLTEARLSAGLASDEGIKERAASSCLDIVRAEARRVRTGMGLLATVGAISPFVGLFGTVWGIMNSFIGISKSQTTNLAVVAPGIAEALLATAIGLAAAIPAVIIYNHFSRVTKAYLELVNRASGAAARLLSRDLDRSHAGVHARAAE
jgi:biopolymer transport protein ExbB